MSRRRHTIAAAYFDALYRANPDPWGFRTSDYEREKYQATLSALRHRHYDQALEVGCANGVFTRLLTARCGQLLALDASPVALDLAREACADLTNIRFVHGAVPDGFPTGGRDLIVLSEVLYYLVSDDVLRVAEECAACLRPGGDIVLCHWTGETDYPLTGHQAAGLFVDAATRLGLAHVRLHDGTYRLDRLSRLDEAGGASP